MTDELVQAALTGSGRIAPETLQAENPAEALGEHMGLLLRAGLRDVYRRAGYVPSPAPEPFPPAPEAREMVCPPLVEPALKEMIEAHSQLPSAPGEALRALAKRSWMLPPGLLVSALSSQPRLPELASVLGERGRWLAELNDDWQWAIREETMPEPSETERIWMEGTKSERVALIRRLRQTDAAGARERVAAGFASEPAPLRQDLVSALEVNLSSADEPFLEAALDDRSKGVRQAAATLLSRLPESAFVGRMVGRTRKLVSRHGTSGGLSVQPAPELPEDWRRDGIGLGLPAGADLALARTVQVLASIPASVLARELAVSLEKLVEAVERYDGSALIESWRQTAAPAERETLLPLLWDMWWAKPLKRATGGDTAIMLARTMSQGVLRHRVLRLLGDPPPGTEHLIVLVLSQVGEPWPSDISRSALGLLGGWLHGTRRKDRTVGGWLQLIEPLAAHAAPETIEETLELLAGIERANVVSAWHHEIQRATNVLRLRERFWNAMATAVAESMTTTGANDGGNG